MNKFAKLFSTLFLTTVIALPFMVACDSGNEDKNGGNEGNELPAFVDYASELKLDLSSDTKKQEVTVRLFIDGDTTHFDPKGSADISFVGGYIKARYLAVNTPESTGDVEKWGKSASNFTYSKLSTAEAIIVESDDHTWNLDSTSERYTLWIWYVPEGKEVKEENYRNLNVELLQEGYGRASKTSENRYGTTALAALMQAQAYELHIFGKEKDPNYYGDEATKQLDLKTLRFNIDDYVQHPVSVQGYVTAVYNSGAYIEEYDEEDGISYGIAVYFGFKTGKLLEILAVNNYVNVIGTVTEFNGTYQISDVKYNMARPKDPANCQLVEAGDVTVHPWREVTTADIVDTANNTVTAKFPKGEDEEGNETFEEKTLSYAKAMMNTSVTLKNLTIKSISTTTNPDSSSKGAMSVTVEDASGKRIVLRTEVLYKADGTTLYTKDDFTNADGSYKTISEVKGIVDYFDLNNTGNGTYQIAIWNWNCFTFAS